MHKADGRTGRREQNKRDKLERIKQAAKDLFTERGFEAATTRDIARKAGVAFGTLFNFADDKRDLIFLIYGSHLDDLQKRTVAAIDPDDPLLDQVVKLVSVYYRDFAANPALARILLKELIFYDRGKLAGAYLQNRMRLVGCFRDLVAASQQRGDVDPSHDPREAALGIFFVYAGALRWWIADERPSVRKGLADLRRFLAPYIDGLSPQRHNASAARSKALHPQRKAHNFR